MYLVDRIIERCENSSRDWREGVTGGRTLRITQEDYDACGKEELIEEVQRLERRIQQKEESIDRKMDNLEKKEDTLQNRIKEAEAKLREANEIKAQQFEALEKISGYTAEQAKEYLLSNLENELVHEKAVKINAYEQKFKDESEQKAKEIIARLSDLSRKNTSLTFQYVSPDELVRKVLAVASPARPPHVEVRTDLACRHLWLRGNEIQLSQMLLNLILNAYHAMEPGGGTLTVATRPEGEFLCFQVSDTGSGISPEGLPHIFEPFFTTKERGKGTGLGLAIVRQVMEEHKGTIAIDTAPGRGTTMLLRFPTITPPEEDT